VSAELETAIVFLGLDGLAWPALFARRMLTATSRPKPAEVPQIVPAADGTGPSAAGAVPPPHKPSLRGPFDTGAGL
jgi:hypothetical protein